MENLGKHETLKHINRIRYRLKQMELKFAQKISADNKNRTDFIRRNDIVEQRK